MKKWTNPEVIELDISETSCIGFNGFNGFNNFFRPPFNFNGGYHHGFGNKHHGFGNNFGGNCGGGNNGFDNGFDNFDEELES